MIFTFRKFYSLFFTKKNPDLKKWNKINLFDLSFYFPALQFDLQKYLIVIREMNSKWMILFKMI